MACYPTYVIRFFDVKDPMLNKFCFRTLIFLGLTTLSLPALAGGSGPAGPPDSCTTPLGACSTCVPEMDPHSMIGAMMLLGGSLVIIFSKKKSSKRES
jgi:hypothetical protein